MGRILKIKLVGTESQKIILAVGELLNNRKVYDEMSRAHSPYGNGDSCRLILNALYGENQIDPNTQQKIRYLSTEFI